MCNFVLLNSMDFGVKIVGSVKEFVIGYGRYTFRRCMHKMWRCVLSLIMEINLYYAMCFLILQCGNSCNLHYKSLSDELSPKTFSVTSQATTGNSREIITSIASIAISTTGVTANKINSENFNVAILRTKNSEKLELPGKLKCFEN